MPDAHITCHGCGASLPLRSPAEVCAWLVARGWTLERSMLAGVWNTYSKDGVVLEVPMRDDFADYQYRFHEVVENICRIDHRPALEILAEMGGV